MGEWFTSFEDAWASFVAREEPLESFFDGFPADAEHVVEAWVIVPPPEVKREVLRLQEALEDVRGLRIVPHHFLHVSLPGQHGPELDSILGLDPFLVRLPRLNCFHEAVVAEVESTELDALDAPAAFLPHLSLAYVERSIDPRPVREVLLPMRERSLGAFVVDELVHVRVPAGRLTILEPWTPIERVPLRR